MPFDPDQYLAQAAPAGQPSFDPDAYLAEQPASAEAPSIMGSLARGVASGATSGLSTMSSKGNIADDQALNPVATTVGEVIGSTAQGMLLPGKKIYDTASGGIEGFSKSQGQPPLERAKATATGAVLGLAFGAIGRKLSGLFPKAAPTLLKKSENKALGVMATDLNKASQKGARVGAEVIQKNVDALKSRGILSQGLSPEAVQEQLFRIKNEANGRLDSLIEQLDANGFSVDSKEVAHALDQEIEKLAVAKRANAGIISDIEKWRADIADLGRAELQSGGGAPIGELPVGIPASMLRNLKTQVADRAFGPFGEVKDDAAFAVWRNLQEATHAIGKKVGGDIGKAIQEESRILKAAIDMSPAVSRRANKSFMEPAIKSPVAYGLEALHKGTEKAIIGSSEWLEKNRAVLGKYGPVIEAAMSRGPRAVASQLYLIQQRDPEFREKLKELESGK